MRIHVCRACDAARNLLAEIEDKHFTSYTHHKLGNAGAGVRSDAEANSHTAGAMAASSHGMCSVHAVKFKPPQHKCC
jgi:hypothetical protein